MEMAFICKKCKKAFRKDMSTFEEADEYCPHCDNPYVSRGRLGTRMSRADMGRSSRRRSPRRCWVWKARMLEWTTGQCLYDALNCHVLCGGMLRADETG